MAGLNNFNANNVKSVVFDADGNKVEVSRPNARDLVMTGKYFWTVEDIGKKKGGSSLKDVKTPTVILVAPSGEEVEVTRANARDLIMKDGYALKREDEESDKPATKAEKPAVEKEPEPFTDELNVVEDSLSDIALRVTGSDDVSAYLETFTEENLRDMLSTRYGESAHHRASKSTIIEKMLNAEANRSA